MQNKIAAIINVTNIELAFVNLQNTIVNRQNKFAAIVNVNNVVIAIVNWQNKIGEASSTPEFLLPSCIWASNIFTAIQLQR